jgi:hypothetical protein
MGRLARAERFEEAASVRDRLEALVHALQRSRAERWLVEAGLLQLEVEGRPIRFRRGALERRGAERGFDWPLPLDAADEVRAAVSCLSRGPVRVLAAERAPAEPIDGGATLARLQRRLEAARR